MSQFDFGTIDPSTKTGTALATDLNSFRTALNSCHSGSSRPTYAVAKTIWVNDATTPWVVYMFDGTDDIQIGTINASTNVFTPSMPNTPAGGIAATTVQGAINELDTEKAKVGSITTSGITQNTARILGRTTASTGAIEEITVGTGLTLSAGSLTASGVTSKIQPVTATQSSGALTFGLNPTTLDFRNTTLTDGVPTTVTVGTLSLVLPSGGTLGAVSGVSARLALVSINNGGTGELAVINVAGGNDLSETGVINTTAISASSTAANVFYSTTTRTGVAYRFVGFVDAINTAGAWGNPTLVQGYGGLVRPISASRVSLHASNGYGSTNTVILRYANIVENLGSDITYSDSATLGASFTINKPGIYAISGVYHNAAAAGHFGISLNSTQLTTAIPSITASNRLAHASCGTASSLDLNASISYYFKAGDIIRPHADGNGTGAAARGFFSICRVG